MTSARPRVLIAQPAYGQIDPTPLELISANAEVVANTLGRKPTAAELIELLPGCQAVVASTEPYDADVIARAEGLRLIARTGAGLDNVDLEAARAHGVAVSCNPEANSDAVAELTLGLILGLARHIVQADRIVRAGGWERLVGGLVRGRTVGLVGLGRIGRRVARLLNPFGCRVLACDIDPAVAPAAAALGVELRSLEELVAEADVLSFHVPLTEVTHGMVDARLLAGCRPGALLVNTSRGGVIDEAALLAALDDGALGGAALDVYAQEPYRGPLAGHEQVILSAHMGSCAREARKAMELGAAQAVVAHLRGVPIPNRVV